MTQVLKNNNNKIKKMKEEGCFWRTTARESLNRPAVCFLKFIAAHIKRVDQIHSTVGVCVCVCVLSSYRAGVPHQNTDAP